MPNQPEINEAKGSIIKDLKIIQHPSIEGEFGIRVVFECLECNGINNIDEFDNEKCGTFLESLKNRTPNRFVYCQKCSLFN